MSIQVEIEIGQGLARRRIQINRITNLEGFTEFDTVNDYEVLLYVGGRTWAEARRVVSHRYGDTAMVLVSKAADAVSDYTAARQEKVLTPWEKYVARMERISNLANHKFNRAIRALSVDQWQVDRDRETVDQIIAEQTNLESLPTPDFLTHRKAN